MATEQRVGMFANGSRKGYMLAGTSLTTAIALVESWNALVGREGNALHMKSFIPDYIDPHSDPLGFHQSSCLSLL